MTAFDYVVFGVLIVSSLIGAWRGFAGEVLSLAAWVLALIAGWLFAEQIGQLLYGSLILDASLRLAAGFATILVLVLLLVGLVKFAVREFIKAVGLTPTDRLLGVSFGLVRGLAIVLLLAALAGLTQFPKEPWWRNAILSGPVETLVIGLKPWLPDDLAKRIRF